VLDRPDHIPASPADRAREALLDDPSASNREIALRARSTPAQVRAVRKALTGLGVLPATPYPQRSYPRFRPLPRPPRELMEGACVGHPNADAWQPGASHYDREMAKNICRFSCHVAELCAEWSLSLPVRDLAIYAGMTASERERVRARRRPGPMPLRLTSAGQNVARNRRRAAARAAREDGAA
jgi:Transcription factor WhiB